MEPVECYKGISNRLFVFGLQPVDIVITLCGFLLVHGIGNSLVVDLIYILIAYIIARKTRERPQGFFISLALFFLTPNRLPLPNEREPKEEKK